MTNPRLAMLKKMAESKPQEPFPRYGLAMELQKTGEDDEAWDVFERLVQDHPDYLPSYLMAGNLLARLFRNEDALGMYDRGILKADAAGDDHTSSELAAARATIVG